MKMSSKSMIMALLAVNILLIAAIVSNSAKSADDLTRITTSFDLKHVDAVLKRVAKVFSAGFGREEAGRLALEIDALKADTRMTWEFTAMYKGSAHPLVIKALVDDLGMVDLDFATTAEVAPQVRAAVDGYLNSRNL